MLWQINCDGIDFGEPFKTYRQARIELISKGWEKSPHETGTFEIEFKREEGNRTRLCIADIRQVPKRKPISELPSNKPRI